MALDWTFTEDVTKRSEEPNETVAALGLNCIISYATAPDRKTGMMAPRPSYERGAGFRVLKEGPQALLAGLGLPF